MKYKRLTALLISAVLLISGCSGLPKERDQTYTGTFFDTVISIQIYDAIEDDVLDGCAKLCEKYDTMFSNKTEDSEISQINHAGGNPVEVTISHASADGYHTSLFFKKLQENLELFDECVE